MESTLILSWRNLHWRTEDGLFHRKGGPAIINTDGYREWLIKDTTHREDRTARLWQNGDLEWLENDKLHRLDGPARIYSDGNVEYWIRGEQVEPFAGTYSDAEEYFISEGESIWNPLQ